MKLPYPLNPCPCGETPKVYERSGNRFKAFAACACSRVAAPGRTPAIAAVLWNRTYPLTLKEAA